MRRARSTVAAFTLVELMIVVALIAIIVTLAAPSFRDMILMQRLRGINAELVTNLHYARSEAISRGVFMHMRFQSDSTMTCYISYASTLPPLTASDCDCTAAAGSRCTDPTSTEVRTVQVLKSDGVEVLASRSGLVRLTIDPRTGGVFVPQMAEIAGLATFWIDTRIDTARRLRNIIKQSGQVQGCTPSGSTVGGTTC